VIPHDEDIQREIVTYLRSRPGHRASADQCYDAFADRFSSLTWEETHVKYRNSISKWANRVQ
jgi:hypothetical protein